jgi:phosphatidylinositol alpha-1,6-mannosyltransferase
MRPDIPSTLVVTNDFPPRVGGVQQYVWNLVRNLPEDRVAILAPNWPGWPAHDADQAFAVHRWPSAVLWPTDDLLRRIRSLIEKHEARVVMFGHGFPLALLGPRLVAEGIPYIALTHGVESWAARAPVLSQALRRALSGAREVTAVSEHTARPIRSLIPPGVQLNVLHPGVDPQRFTADSDGTAIRRRHGLGSRPVILCVSRLVPRKGQDVLIASMPMVRRLAPDTALLLVGGGPHRGVLAAAAATEPKGSVVFAGEVPDAELPQYYAACDVFAMPCRSRWGGLEAEGFGIVFLEAAAAAKPAVAGRSGGAAEAVVDQVTGLLVEGKESKAVALAITRLLLDPGLRARMGAAARAHVERGFTWSMRATELAAILVRAAG